MFIVLRQWAGPEAHLAVFDSEEKANMFVRACKRCHAKDTWRYSVRPIGFNLLCD
jgi:hypothetical protein